MSYVVEQSEKERIANKTDLGRASATHFAHSFSIRPADEPVQRETRHRSEQDNRHNHIEMKRTKREGPYDELMGNLDHQAGQTDWQDHLGVRSQKIMPPQMAITRVKLTGGVFETSSELISRREDPSGILENDNLPIGSLRLPRSAWLGKLGK